MLKCYSIKKQQQQNFSRFMFLCLTSLLIIQNGKELLFLPVVHFLFCGIKFFMTLGLSRIWGFHPACRIKTLLLFYIFCIIFFFFSSSVTYSVPFGSSKSRQFYKITLENVDQAAVEFDRKYFYL